MAESATDDAGRESPGRGWRAPAMRIARACRRAAGCLRDLAHGATGSHAYEQYLAHQHAHHPGAPVLGREDFFRRELAARWDGIRRCC